ncbi:Phospholipase A2 [Rhynchospora pubera]|uniref:Phospholipase A2 n=1 Tax=Rhynchospora pubera TaxID=906938 RepID=A0AAV8GJC8_9POAL|nr:Phospholipase A2 [Rhynchospora pubera]
MRRSNPSRLLPSPLLLLLFVASCCDAVQDSQPQVRCSRSCVAENCNSLGIKYGKYCGVGWSGCPSEKPCDDLDACCKIHDECVEKKGMTSVWCHEKFKQCIQKVKKSGKMGFSKVCPYEVAMPTMIQAVAKLGFRVSRVRKIFFC